MIDPGWDLWDAKRVRTALWPSTADWADGDELWPAEQLFRRMVFNLVARNQDDHVKDIAFLMSRDGAWHLAPAYDLTWAYKPGNRWLHAHQMTINGKRDDVSADDLRTVARLAGLKRGRDTTLLREITDVVADWPAIADDVGVNDGLRDQARATHRLALPSH